CASHDLSNAPRPRAYPCTPGARFEAGNLPTKLYRSVSGPFLYVCHLVHRRPSSHLFTRFATPFAGQLTVQPAVTADVLRDEVIVRAPWTGPRAPGRRNQSGSGEGCPFRRHPPFPLLRWPLAYGVSGGIGVAATVAPAGALPVGAAVVAGEGVAVL